MKKLISVVIACAAALSISVCAGARNMTASELPVSVVETEDGDVSGSIYILQKNKKLSASELDISDGEVLIVPEGKTLYLDNDCTINGTIYVAEKGKLFLRDGKCTVNGSVYSDGTVSVNRSAKLTVTKNGELIISKSGKLRATSSKSLDFHRLSDVVCVGSTNCKKVRMGKTIMYALVNDNGRVSALSDKAAAVLAPEADMYFTGDVLDDSIRSVTLVFNDGSVVKANMCGGKYIRLGNTCISDIIMAIDPPSEKWESPESNIIDGKTYYWNMNCAFFVMDDNGEIKELERNFGWPDLNDPLCAAICSLDSLEYIGKFTGRPDSIGNANADMYRVSEKCILQIWQIDDWSWVSASDAEELQKLYELDDCYHCALYYAS
ncbi:MAG: hypothetical protein J6A16_12480 [Oscillospiraceae bacterium]|nr:hypothetical protein [Oscillospiraceae bacterium]